MIIETIAAGAIAFLSPYLAEAGKSIAKKAGEGLEEKAASIYQSIKSKFAGDNDAEQTLALVAAKPDSKARQSSLEEVLIEKMQNDQNFAAMLQRLVEEAKAIAPDNVVSSGERNVTIGRDATNNTIITGDSNTIGNS